jgi:GTP-binding protein
MASFIDEITLHIRAGNGGNGVVRWRHEKGRDKAGAAGGNGGRGGDVFVRSIRNLNILANYRHIKEFAAKDGGHGMKLSMDGKAGEDLILDVPIGSTIKNTSTGKIYTLLEENQTVKILSGGRGGLGNEHFKASTNVRPIESTPGKPGEEAEFYIELSLVADAGLIGLPNAGKSSLLNAVTNATSKVGSYPFTTINPHLGPLFGYVLADIPGLIAGASEGKGLGHKFLRHISRTRLIIHCVSAENENVTEAYKTIRGELAAYVHEEDPTSAMHTPTDELPQNLTEKPELVILTKTDTVTPAELKKKKAELTKVAGKKSKVLDVSVLSDESVEALSKAIVSYLS